MIQNHLLGVDIVWDINAKMTREIKIPKLNLSMV